MSLSCRTAARFIPELALGDLDEGARFELQEHERACDRCAGSMEFHEELQAAIEAIPRPSPPPVYFEGVLAEVHRRMPRMPGVVNLPRRRLPEIPRHALATIAMVCIVCFWLGGFVSLKTEGDPLGQERGLRGSRPSYAYTAAAGGLERGASATPHAKSRAVALTWSPQLGFVSADSPLLEFTTEQLAELGLKSVFLVSEVAMIAPVGTAP